jgi:hypothetical protein
MTDYIGLHDEYALVPPQTFVDRLTDQWTTAYHNVPSVPLRQLWTTMANTYREAIIDTATCATPRWRILWPQQANRLLVKAHMRIPSHVAIDFFGSDLRA